MRRLYNDYQAAYHETRSAIVSGRLYDSTRKTLWFPRYMALEWYRSR